jgi:hypothetical protein
MRRLPDASRVVCRGVRQPEGIVAGLHIFSSAFEWNNISTFLLLEFKSPSFQRNISQ